ncbi:MAG: hypothetical protein FWC12_10080 [Treponema sp.]|nr:hypothetical protein [Treponema sp.]
MSNGLTSVFISTFGLSGSILAKTEQEKKLVMYILEKNQSILGIGFVDFDIGSMPWDLKNLEDNKKFVFSILDGIKNKTEWEKLPFTPNEEMLNRCIFEFKNMISEMKSEDINEKEINEWSKNPKLNDLIKNGFPLCPSHDVLMTIYGCQMCTEWQ